MSTYKLRGVTAIRLAGVLVTLVLAIAWNAERLPGNGFLGRLDTLLYDLRYRWTLPWQYADVPADHQIAIVDIDEKSLAAVGRWPWPRETVARLTEQLFAAGAAMAAFDVVFAEPQLNPVAQVLAVLPESDPARPFLLQKTQGFDGDRVLAESLQQGDTLLGYFLFNEASSSKGQLPAPMKTALPPEVLSRLIVPRMHHYTANLPQLQAAALSGGFITTIPDGDGVVRRSPLLLMHQGQLYPALALEAARQYLFVDQVTLKTAAQGDVEVIESIGLDDFVIPTDGAGRVLIPYRGGGHWFPYVSAVDVLQHPDRWADTLEGAIVFVGTSSLGLADLRTTPIQVGYPGVEVHASILDAILRSNQKGFVFPHQLDPDLNAAFHYVLIGLMGILLTAVLPALGPWGQLAAFLATLSGVLGLNLWLWLGWRLDFSPAPYLLLMLALFPLNLFYRMFAENARRQALRSMFSQYVPREHIDALLEQDALGMEGDTRDMSVLFSDIRGFTRISESMSAAELKQMLNRFFTPITRVIFEHKGTIDKYVGDMVMAFWGAPLPDEHHSAHAVAAGLAMLEIVDSLKAEFAAQGLPEINVGIGINSGLMNVGDMGSDYRKAYTVIGDAVNLGSRLESITKFYGVRILVSEHTREAAEEFEYRLVDRIRVKGRAQPVSVYEPIGLPDAVDESLRERIDRFHRAQQLYFQQRWDEAEQAFAELAEAYPERLVEVYRQRIAVLRETCPDDWDGVFSHTEK